MTDELKPSACTVCLPWGFSDASDAARKKNCWKCLGTGLVYAIPPTHRVVSVAQLERLLEVIAWPDHPAAIQLRAIIDNPAEEYQK